MKKDFLEVPITQIPSKTPVSQRFNKNNTHKKILTTFS